ncbi:hypothetical protein [Yersinia alsatica]|uniref:hypothetical protein n=1 Tax=Yersinia alsatica TaxID=2890317 RepID=UPI0011A79F8F|nr:hypothetical protein [Yersinia alsatica]
MAKKARFFNVTIQTAFEGPHIYPIPVPAPTAHAAKKQILSTMTNVLDVRFMGWFNVDINCSGMNCWFTVQFPDGTTEYQPEDPGWHYLSTQFEKTLDQIENEMREHYGYE